MKTLKIIAYWFLSLTWGGLLTLTGLLILPFMLLAKGKIHRNGYTFIVEVGGNWGGLNLGAISYCGGYSKTNPEWFDHTRAHEFGHSLQNLIFGPFQIFLVSIPSGIRYWYQYFRSKKGLPNAPYDSIWFEHTASKYGTKAINKIESTNIPYSEWL